MRLRALMEVVGGTWYARSGGTPDEGDIILTWIEWGCSGAAEEVAMAGLSRDIPFWGGGSMEGGWRVGLLGGGGVDS